MIPFIFAFPRIPPTPFGIQYLDNNTLKSYYSVECNHNIIDYKALIMTRDVPRNVSTN
jgi:hypothetical protein